MWKNVFIESCILSALIFGGFYLNTVYLKNEISETQSHIESGKSLAHISGNTTKPENLQANSAHICGNDESSVEVVSPISGAEQPLPKSPKKVPVAR